MEGCCPPLLDCGIAHRARCATFQTGPRSDNASALSECTEVTGVTGFFGAQPEDSDSIHGATKWYSFHQPRGTSGGTDMSSAILTAIAASVSARCPISSPHGYLACSTAVRYSFLVDAREVMLIACGVDFCLTCLQIVAGNAHRTGRATASGRASYE